MKRTWTMRGWPAQRSTSAAASSGSLAATLIDPQYEPRVSYALSQVAASQSFIAEQTAASSSPFGNVRTSGSRIA